MSTPATEGRLYCFYDQDGHQLHEIYAGSMVYLPIGMAHRFYLELDDKPVSRPAERSNNKILQTEWIYILNSLWKADPESQTKNGSSRQSVANQANGKIGNEITLTPQDADSRWIGHIYRMDVRNYFPDSAFYFFFVVIDRPKIRFAYFDKQNLSSPYNGFHLNDGFYNYGQIIGLHIHTHMMLFEGSSAISTEYLSQYERDPDNLELRVWITDVDQHRIQEEPVVQAPVAQFIALHGGMNLKLEVPIPIKAEWKDQHAPSEKIKWYTADIEIVNTRTGQSYMADTFLENYQQSNPETGLLEEKEASKGFYVKYQTNQHIRRDLEINKNNMLTQVGDVDYTIKESNPCAFSTITVQSGKHVVELFNEHKLSEKGDKTGTYFDVLASDTEKTDIKITAAFLEQEDAKPEPVRTKSRGYFCHQILNNGKDHKTIHDVFKMDWIVGQWVPSKDPEIIVKRLMDRITYAHTRLSLISPEDTTAVKKIDNYISDQEAKGIIAKSQAQYENVSVAHIQGLLEEDYTIDDSKDSITLRLNYHYDKTVAEGTKFQNKWLDNLWVFRYFLMDDSLHQLYFIPVTTCRYPNQVVKIRVFPKITWGITFSIGSIDKKYKEDWREDLSKERKKVLEEYTGYINYASTDQAKQERTKKKEESLQKLDLKLGFKVTVDKEMHELTQNFSDNIKDTIYAFVQAKEVFDSILGNGEGSPTAKDKERKFLASAKKSKLLKNLTKLPIQVAVDSPAIDCGLAWGYKKQSVTDMLKKATIFSSDSNHLSRHQAH